MERVLKELVDKLRQAHGEHLISVILYGSAAVPGAKDQLSDFNVLSVLKQVTPQELAEAEPVFRWWREMKNPAPLLLSEDEVRTATDCFPIEFNDIREQHAVLYGLDIVRDLDIDESFYRAQVEHELRAKLLRLRQKAGGVLSEKDLLLRLMADSVSTFLVLFRHVLRLTGHPSVFEKRDVVAAVKDNFGVDPQPFTALLDLREGKVKASALQPAPLFREYLKQIEAVVAVIDRIAK